jgi:ABC-2 type transport system ATP-binding protein
MSKSTLIEVQNLTRYYAGHCAVNCINFNLHRGEVLGFLGPNGAGKSTTLQMLAGTLAASSGQIQIDGIDLQESPHEAKRRIGYLPETPPLYVDLSVDEYLQYCAALHGVERYQTGEALVHAKHRCGLDQVGQRLIRNLSKGYQQRVGIAQAIIHNPAIIMLDEPTVGLDPNQIREIRDLIRELGRDHSVILSTHILPEVQSVCDRVLIINKGQLVLDEKLAALNARQSACLRIGLKHAPAESVLAELADVTHIEQLDAEHFLLHHSQPEQLAAVLAERAAAENWGLFELSPQRQTLEDLFVQLTCHEENAA